MAHGAGGLQEPHSISTPNRQSVYLFDIGKRLIHLLNPNLRIIRSWDFFDLEIVKQTGNAIEILPAAFDASPTGELFVLDANDNHVYKLDRFANYRMDFGGNTYGAGSLRSPDGLQLSPKNVVYVTDSLAQSITVFDNFGTYLRSHSAPEDFQWRQFAQLEQYLFYIRSKAPQILAERRPDGSQRRLTLPLAPGQFHCFAHSKALYFLQNGLVMRLTLDAINRR